LDNEFQAIWSLLRSAQEPEFLARDSGTLPDHVRELMRRFAEGKLDARDRDSLVEAMTARPDWISHLAREIKERRGGREAED
jgi:hypothetical protein